MTDRIKGTDGHRREVNQELTIILGESQLIRRRIDRGDHVDPSLISAALRRIEDHAWNIRLLVEEHTRYPEGNSE